MSVFLKLMRYPVHRDQNRVDSGGDYSCPSDAAHGRDSPETP